MGLFDVSDEGMDASDRLAQSLEPYLREGTNPHEVVAKILMEFRLVPKSSIDLSRDDEPPANTRVRASNGLILIKTGSGDWTRAGMHGFSYGKTWQELWDAIGPFTLDS